MERSRPTFATIDLAQLNQNFTTLRAMVDSRALVCPMVKANAYGHGDVQVARSLRMAGASHVGVALVEEGIKLRLSGESLPILVFGPIYDAEAARQIIAHRLTPVIGDRDQLEMFLAQAAAAGLADFAVHLEFDTGMNRLGFSWREAESVAERCRELGAVKIEGICSHLLRGDDFGRIDSVSASQLEAFAEICGHFVTWQPRAHLLNSSGATALAARARNLIWPTERFGPLGFRPGIALYGLNPCDDLAVNVKPVLRWQTQIAMIRSVQIGETVSYNATWRAKRPSLIGVLPVGYGDGYRRALSNSGRVLVRGFEVPVVGTVCMDYMMIDLTDVPHPSAIDVGTEVVLIGDQGSARVTADDLAALIGTISYEILTGISERVPRIYENPEPGSAL